jgi:hypothetical protein
MLRDGRFGVRILALTIVFLFSKASRPALASTKPLTQWVTGFLSGGKAAGA